MKPNFKSRNVSWTQTGSIEETWLGLTLKDFVWDGTNGEKLMWEKYDLFLIPVSTLTAQAFQGFFWNNI